MLSCAPGTPVDELPGDRRLAVCEALADFADLKSARRGPHSHGVASLAARAASSLGLPAAEQERLRRAGLVHDLGKIAVPNRLLEQAGDDTLPASGRDGAGALTEPVRSNPLSVVTLSCSLATCPASSATRAFSPALSARNAAVAASSSATRASARPARARQ